MNTQNRSKPPEVGRNMELAFRYVQQVYKETAQLMRRLDGLMGKEWSPTFGNRTTRGVTSHLDDPEYWLPEGSFRIYDLKGRPNMKKGITVAYWSKDIDEPLLIAGKLDYVLNAKAKKPKKQDHWDLWEAWFMEEYVASPEQDRKTDGTIYETEFDEDAHMKTARVFAIPLATIQSETDIKTKVYDKLISL